MKKRVGKIILFSVLSVTLIAAIAAIAAAVTLTAITHSDDYVKFDQSKLGYAKSAVTVLDCNGERLNQPVDGAQGKRVPLNALHDYTYNAFVSVEDKRFFQHGGVDIKRIAGAAVHNLQSGGFKEGASTISQQLIKNTHLSNGKTIKRKVNEMLLALQLEKSYSKQEILEMYLNTIYFGRSAYGIENAANAYFDKSAAELSVAESATLAGMIKAPNVYSPDKNAEKCKDRRDLVLKTMLENDVISQEQYSEAVATEVVYKPQSQVRGKTYCNAVVDEACRVLNMTRQQLLSRNLTIETYYSPQAQSCLEAAVAKDKTLCKDGSLANITCIVCDVNCNVTAYACRGENVVSRQIGSTAKPFAVYAPAINEKLITQASPVLDEKTSFGGYVPSNYGNKYYGWTTVKTALVKSLNVPAVKVLNSLGTKTAERYLQSFGVNEPQNLSLALGNVTGGMGAEQLTAAYATLANGGRHNDCAFIKRISDENGVIYQRKQTNESVFSPSTAYIVTDMLTDVARYGTAKTIGKTGVTVAAKTGTVGNTDGNSDALVCGYTPSCVFTVWLCGDLPNNVTGATAPCAIAADFVKTACISEEFATPSGIARLCVDDEQLKNNQLVVLSENGEEFLFDKNNLPKAAPSKAKPTLNATLQQDGVHILLSNTEGDVKLFRESDGKTVELKFCGAEYVDKAPGGAYAYYATSTQNGKVVYTTPRVKIVVPKSQTPPPADDASQSPNLLDFWYFHR